MIIKKLERKELTNGSKKWNAMVIRDGQPFFFGAFCEDWNENWHEGMELNPEPTQWSKREYNGKDYYDLRRPKNLTATPSQPGQTTLGTTQPQSNDTAKILDELKKIRSLLEGHGSLLVSLTNKNAYDLHSSSSDGWDSTPTE